MQFVDSGIVKRSASVSFMSSFRSYGVRCCAAKSYIFLIFAAVSMRCAFCCVSGSTVSRSVFRCFQIECAECISQVVTFCCHLFPVAELFGSGICSLQLLSIMP